MATDTVLITHVTGKAWMRNADGQLIALHEGMRVPVDAHIFTDEGASVTLQATGVPPVVVGQNTDMVVTEDLAAAQPQAVDHAVTPPTDNVADQVLAALQNGQDPFSVLDPTAAVLLTGGGDGGASFTRLAAVIESVSPLSLSYPRPGVETPEFVELSGIGGDGVAAAAAGEVPSTPIPAGPTIDISDHHDVPGGDGEGPVLVPGTFSIFEGNTPPAPQSEVALFALQAGAPDPQPSHDGVKGVFTITAAAGLSGLQFNYVPEANPGAAPGTNPDGGNSTAAPTNMFVSAANLLNASEAHPVEIDTDRGLLHITGYNAGTGEVTYIYWSDGAQDHVQPANDTSVFDTIGITVIDSLGRGASGELVANITDDVPVAVDDANAIGEDGASVTGNVLGTAGATAGDHADTQGADGATVTGVQAPGATGSSSVSDSGTTVFSGQYGDLIIDAQGQYTYTLATEGDDRYLALQGLAEGQEVTEVFKYTLTDGDGDQASASLTVTVTGTNDGPVPTAGDIGDQVGKDAQTIAPVDVSGEFTDVDTGDTLTYTATGLPPGLSISADGVITGTLDHSASQGGPDGDGVYKVTVTATDSHEAAASKEFTWDVTNPAPVAADDDGATSQGVALTVTAADGVLSNDTDPDGDSPLTVTQVNGVEGNVGTAVAGDHGGTFTLNDDGSYTFKPGSDFNGLGQGATATSSITYQVSDGEGGFDTATLTVTVTGTNDVPTISVPDAPNLNGVSAVVTEESLSNVIPDNTGTPDGDHSSSAVFTGTITVGDPDTPLSSLTLSLGTGVTAAQGPGSGGGEVADLTSHGNTVHWVNVGGKLVGYTGALGGGDYHEVLTVQLNASNTGASRGYTVTLHDTLDHPQNSVEDVIDLKIPVTVSDGSLDASTTITVRIEDDMPVAVDNPAPVQTTSIDIPDIYTGKVDFSGYGGSKSGYSFDNGAITVTAMGFTSKDSLDLGGANVYQGSNGLGVKSSKEPYFPLDGEIDYRKVGDQGASEELTIQLSGDKVAYGVTVEFAEMFGGELERGVALFYRGGVLVSTQEFSSTASSGDYAANFRVEDGGFDKIVFRALDNGKSASHGDNSDFAVKSITFLGTEEAQPIAYATGHIALSYGADGPGDLNLASAETGLKTADGRDVFSTVSADGNTITGKDADGHLVYEIRLTPATGQWEFYQYQAMDKTADGHVDFNYIITDADGDGASGHVAIGVNTAPEFLSGTDTVDTPPNQDAYSFTQADPGTGSPVVGQVHAHDADGDTLSYQITDGNASGHYSIDSSTGEIRVDSSKVGDLFGTEVTDQVTVQVSDGKGGVDTATVDIHLVGNTLVTGTDDQNTLTGNIGNDILLGDTGGVKTTVQPGQNYNIALVVDTSGSMSDASGQTKTVTGRYQDSRGNWKNGPHEEPISRMDLVKDALENLATQLAGHDGKVNVALIGFAGSATDVTPNRGESSWVFRDLDASSLQALISKIDSLSASGGTNYESAFQEAGAWYQSLPSDGSYKNLTFFLTDGNPTSSNSGSGYGGGNHTDYSDVNNALDDFQNLSNYGEVHAVGIGSGVNESILKFFDNTDVVGQQTVNIDGQNLKANAGSVDIVNNADDLNAALQGGGHITPIHCQSVLIPCWAVRVTISCLAMSLIPMLCRGGKMDTLRVRVTCLMAQAWMP